MWKDTAATELPKTTAPVAPQPVTEEELRELLDRLGAARNVFRENRELRVRNAELEEIVRKFAPMLLDAATAMGLAAKNEKPDTLSQR